VLPGCCSTGFQKDSGIAEEEMDLKPEDLAQSVVDICNLPKHVVIEEITVWGMNQVVIPL
jgi:NADP-dependent 3-hydroxy acid dehydrogenase YdfG